jgi:polysaccharide export outer membrane protein
MRILFLLFSGFVLAACNVANTDFPVRTQAIQSEVQELSTNVAIVQLTANNIDAFNTRRDLGGSRMTAPSSGWNYRVGVGDVLDVVVWNHPDLTQPSGGVRTPQESGQRVQSDGTFFYPYVGQVPARGRTPEEIRDDLAKRLAQFIPDPQVGVRVVGYKSQAVSVTGEVQSSSRQALTDVPLTLLDAIDAAGGMTEEADARSIMLRRAGRSYTVDMQAFLEQGVGANNPILQNGDVVSVGRQEVQEAYLLGQIVKPSTIDLTRDNVTLTQALTRLGGLREDQADARGIFVFRDTPMGITIYQLDASTPVAFLLGTRFVILPQDVIYVTTAPLYRWNRLISQLLPSLEGVRAVNTIASLTGND